MKRWALALVMGVVGVAACTSDDGSPSALPSTESTTATSIAPTTTTTVCPGSNPLCTPECVNIHFAISAVIRAPDHTRPEYEAAYQEGVDRCGWPTLEDMMQGV